MNLILIQADELELGHVRLADHRADHLRKVLKAKPGDTVRVGVIGGLMGSGRIRAISRDEAVIEVMVNTLPPAKLGLHLILALPRPIMVKRILAQAATLGVNHLYLINAQRVEKSFFGASPVKDGTFSSFLLKGLEQAIDTIMPTVSVHPRFRPFIEDVLPGLTAGRRLIAHPQGAAGLAGLASSPLGTGPTLLAIGPEGGWLDFEVTKFMESGFEPFSLGPRILRVNTAVPAIIAQIGLLLQMQINVINLSNVILS